jgi:hypothetical protein
MNWPHCTRKSERLRREITPKASASSVVNLLFASFVSSWRGRYQKASASSVSSVVNLLSVIFVFSLAKPWLSVLGV